MNGDVTTRKDTVYGPSSPRLGYQDRASAPATLSLPGQVVREGRHNREEELGYLITLFSVSKQV